MVREKLTADSRHAFVFATPTAVNGVAFQRRETEGGASIHTAGPNMAPPVALRLQRSGDLITAFWRASDADPWTPLGSQTLSGLSATVYVGMAVTSHSEGSLATAFFRGFNITADPPPDPALPEPFLDGDIGSVGVAGTARFDGTTFTVTGSGTDIWGTSDQFHFVYRPMMGDGTIIARVTSLQHAHVWAKAGVMIRNSLAADAAHAFMFVTPDGANGLAYQRRLTEGGATVHTSGGAGAAPAWVALWRTGSIIHAFRSEDGVNWTWIGGDNIPMQQVIYVGLAVTSHDNTTTATATFDGVVVAQ
jgi:regulation of enolase protein 1 (concanavalin A-like superfamily)